MSLLRVTRALKRPGDSEKRAAEGLRLREALLTSLVLHPCNGDLLMAESDAKMVYLLQGTVAASIAGGMIAATGRSHSVEEAVKVFEDVLFHLYPAHGHSRYESWKHGFNSKAEHK